MIPTVGSSFGGPTTTAVNGLVAENRAGLCSELATTVSDSDPQETEPALERLRENGVKTHLFGRTRLLKRGEAWGLSPALAWWLIRNVRQYDVVHLQYVWCMTSIVGAIAARLAGVPVVITPHESLTDFDIDVASRRRSLRLLKLILRRLFLASADRIVFMSQIEQRDTRYGSTPVELISHAVLEEPTEMREAELSEGLRIAFLGRNIEKKGIHLLVEAIGRNRDRQWRLAVAGPPGEEDYMRQVRNRARELEIEDRIEWAGFLSDRRELFPRTDLLAMPSVYEGFGMVAAEAMCSGRAVVVPLKSGVAELVSEYEAGIVMAESSVEALEDAFRQLEDSPTDRRRFALNGLKAANERLTYAAYAERTSALYRVLRKR